MAALAWARTFLVITFLVGVVVAVHQLTPVVIPVRAFISLIVFWYTLAVVYVILRRWIPQVRWHAPLQVVCDLVIVTGVVYATGGQDSYFLSLYLLVILMSSVLFFRRGAFLVAGMSFVLLGSVIELMYYGVIARTSNSMPAARSWDPGWPAICSHSARSPIWAVSSLKHFAPREWS